MKAWQASHMGRKGIDGPHPLSCLSLTRNRYRFALAGFAASNDFKSLTSESKSIVQSSACAGWTNDFAYSLVAMANASRNLPSENTLICGSFSDKLCGRGSPTKVN